MKTNKIFFISTINFAFNQYLKDMIRVLEKDENITLISNFSIYDKESFSSKQIDIPIKRGLNPLNLIKIYFKLFNIILRHRPKTIYTISPIVGFIVSLIPKYKITHIHFFTGQVWYNKSGFTKFFLKLIDILIGRRCHFSLIDSPSQRRFLIENKIIKKNNSYVLGYGSIRGNKVNSLTTINHPNKKKQLLFVGRVNREKGFDLIIKFINKNANWLKNNKISIVVAGKVEDNELLKSLKYPELLSIKGHLNSLVDLYSESYCLILPSEREGFGSVVIEAGIYYTPSILSKIVGLVDAGNNKSSIFISTKDYMAFSQAVKKIFSNSQLHRNMSLNAHNHSKKFYSDFCTNYYVRFHKLIINRCI
jgi:glycosyltransferase involved in cell wall biosynthesis